MDSGSLFWICKKSESLHIYNLKIQEFTTQHHLMSGALDIAAQATTAVQAITDQEYTGCEAFFGIGGVAAAVIFASTPNTTTHLTTPT